MSTVRKIVLNVTKGDCMKRIVVVMLLTCSPNTMLSVASAAHVKLGNMITSDVNARIKKQHPELAESDPKHKALRGQMLMFSLSGIKKELEKFDSKWTPIIRAALRHKYRGYSHHDKRAKVSTGPELFKGERLFEKNRIPKVRRALHTHFGIPQDKHMPRIAFAGSGGGYRAMLSTLGFLIGAQKIGLLDSALYTSALSGSTWIAGPWSWLAYKRGLSLESIKGKLKAQVQHTSNIQGKNLLPIFKGRIRTKFMS